jgi:hypothetical protein
LTVEALAEQFVGDVARLRAVHYHNQLATVAASDVIDWLSRKVVELQAAEAVLLELVELPAAWPLGVKAWLGESIEARGRLACGIDAVAADAVSPVIDLRVARRSAQAGAGAQVRPRAAENRGRTRPAWSRTSKHWPSAMRSPRRSGTPSGDRVPDLAPATVEPRRTSETASRVTH